jgi:hypothetical protein
METKKIVPAIIIGLFLTTISTIRSEILSVSDLTVIKYGFPLFWLQHQTISIAGPVNIWLYQWLMLIGNLTFWCVISLVIFLVFEKYKK